MSIEMGELQQRLTRALSWWANFINTDYHWFNELRVEYHDLDWTLDSPTALLSNRIFTTAVVHKEIDWLLLAGRSPSSLEILISLYIESMGDELSAFLAKRQAVVGTYPNFYYKFDAFRLYLTLKIDCYLIEEAMDKYPLNKAFFYSISSLMTKDPPKPMLKGVYD